MNARDPPLVSPRRHVSPRSRNATEYFNGQVDDHRSSEAAKMSAGLGVRKTSVLDVARRRVAFRKYS